MNKNSLLYLRRKINFIILLKIKANNDNILKNYLIYIDSTIDFKEFKNISPNLKDFLCLINYN